MDGPYNEHLIRDAGGAYLMITALAIVGLARKQNASPLAVGLATMFFNLPHFAYHRTHLGMFKKLDRVLNVLVLGAAVLGSLWPMTPYASARAPEVH